MYLILKKLVKEVTFKAVTTAIFITLLTVNLFSQWNPSPTVNSQVCTAAGIQKSPVVVADTSGGVIAAWLDERNPSFTKIYLQKFNSAGIPQWQINGVELVSTQVAAENLMAIPDGLGGIILCWKSQEPGANALYYARKVTSNGTPAWPTEIAVSDNYTASNHDEMGCITTDNNGGIIICYKRYNNAISKFEIHAQNISSTGLKTWGVNGVTVATTITPSVTFDNPQICPDQAGGVILAYQKVSRVVAQRLNYIGQKQWGSEGFDIYGSTVGSMINPVICHDGVGGAIITALDMRTPANEFDLYAQRVKNGGVMWGATGKPIAVAINRQWYVKIISDGNYGAYIGWDDQRVGSGFDSRPYIQRIDLSGNLYFTINGIKVSEQLYGLSGLASNDSSAVYMVSSTAPNYPNINIYGVKMSNTGSSLWGSAPVPVSTYTSEKSFDIGSFAVDNTGGLVCVWQDGRNGTAWDIYGHKIQSSGLTGVISSNETPSKFGLGQNYPNPFNPSTKIKYQIVSNNVNVRLSVFDNLGRHIKDIVNREQNAGSYEADFDGSSLSSGVYFYKLSAGDYSETKKMLLVK